MSQALGNQRRVRGTGGISKRVMHRKNGGPDYTIWQGTIGIDGKRQMVYGQTQKEVADKLKAKLAAPVGTVATNGRKTVGEYLTDWLKIICASKAPQTCKSYTMFVGHHLIPAIGSIKLDKLTTADVAGMLRDRPELSPRTINHLRSVLRGALQLAVDAGDLPRNVAAGKGAGVPKQVAQTEPVFLTPANVARLLDSAKGDRLLGLYIAAVRLGARQGELLGLLWSDVDFKNGKISFSKQLQRVGGRLVSQPLKTKRSKRTVYMGSAVAAALVAHRDRQAVERDAAGSRWSASPDFVFRSTVGTGCEGVNVTRDFQKAVAAAGLPAMRFHDLRHTCASIRLDLGESMLKVSRLLGHSNIALTANTYAHLMPESGRDDADLMDRAF
jgi:integrase